MLTLLAFDMIATFMTLIMTKRMSVLTALVLVPIVFAIAGGFARSLGPMMLDGVRALAPTAVMLLCAIPFFSIMIDVGQFPDRERLPLGSRLSLTSVVDSTC
jgi:CitMHS family citrate-Mg2+:H+ or citrate-Ca2+:H+ symporter